MRFRRWGFAFLMIGAVVLLIELLAAAAFYAVVGSAISVASLKTERAQILAAPGDSTDNFEVAGLALPLDVDIHPFHGFGRPPGFDFLSDPKRPEQTDPKTFVVALTGGSVAWELREQSAITDAIRSLPQLADRNVYFIMLGFYAWKQPQQAQALTYYLTHGGRLDVLINLDGRNEIADVNKNLGSGVFPSYPWLWKGLVTNTATPEELSLIASQTWWRENRETVARVAERFCVGLTLNTIWKLADRAIVRRVERNSSELSAPTSANQRERPFRQFGPQREFKHRVAAITYAAEVWAQSSIQMHRIAQANGAKYFHFLQPNQYVPGSKILTEEERRQAFDPRREREIVVGYEALAVASQRFEAAGVAYADLTEVFGAVEDTIYRDRCCHLNARGSRLLAEEIAERVAAVLR